MAGTTEIEGQLNPQERALLAEAILNAPVKPEVVVEVGTWLGGGSTVTILRALEKNGTGHLWGVEADPSIYERMMANLTTLAPDVVGRFTPLFGFSDKVLPRWIEEQKKPLRIDLAFLDGGNNPAEQIIEFELLDPFFAVGARMFGHDASARKGKFLVPFVARLDNWEMQVHNFGPEGLMDARKIAAQPSAESLRAAKAHLAGLRSQPLELAARYAPQGLKNFIFSVMPQRFAQRIADGRK